MDRERGLAQVAEKYRCEGYRVIERPAGGDLPPFAEGRGVDLVAYRDGEKVLVQVKRTHQELLDAPDAMELAEGVSRHPEWRFDLVVLNEDGPQYKVPPEAAEPSVEDIEKSLTDAEGKSAVGDVRLSCVLSWAALEAAMRHAARAAGIEARNAAPAFLLQALYADGYLARDEFDGLKSAMKVRNALVHGLTLPAVDPALPQYIAGVARRLLSTNGQPAT